MRWFITHARRILGFEDFQDEDIFVGTRQAPSIKIKVALGAAIILGLALVIFAVASSVFSSTMQPELPQDLEVTSSAIPPERSVGGIEVLVHVVGEVNVPGMYQLSSDSRVIDAVMAAGGLTNNAAECAINLARVVNDGEQLNIPSLNQGCSGGSLVAAQGATVSLNSGTAEQFDSLPGIGPTLAQRIVQYRESQGGFSSVEQLNDVSGIGDKLFAGVRDLLTL